MKYRTRRYFSETDKVLMWDHWRKGDSLHAIARLFDSSHSAVAGVFSKTGGIRPPPRRRSQRALTLAEREEIESPRVFRRLFSMSQAASARLSSCS